MGISHRLSSHHAGPPLRGIRRQRVRRLDLPAATFTAMFAAMPVSFLLPSRVLILLPATLLAAWLILLNLKVGKQRSPALGFAPVLAMMGLIATASLVANAQQPLAIASYLGGYFSVVVVYLAVRLHQPSVDECHRALVVFSAVAGVSLLVGIKAFHSTVGIPSLSSLMAARFMTEQIAPYQEVTWGNVNNTATFLVQIMPLLLVPLLDPTRPRKIRLWLFAGVIVCGLNMLIVGSRAAFLVFPVYLAAALYYSRSMNNKSATLVILGTVFAVVLFLNGDDGRFWDYLSRATSIENGDESVMERIDSICEGWDVMWEHAIFGVGPGCAPYHISYDAAHQMSVNHGVEYGVLGMLANIALVIQVSFRLTQSLKARLKAHAARLEFTVLLSAFSFLLIGSLANAVISLGATNPWATTLAATLGIADCYRGGAWPKRSIQPLRAATPIRQHRLKTC